MTVTASAPGKIILTGEYAVVFGHAGIAVPSPLTMDVTWTQSNDDLHLARSAVFTDPWISYTQNILNLLEKIRGSPVKGMIDIATKLPLGKGMGSSTALVIALSRAILGDDCETHARTIEDTVNPGHSGLDFSVTWHNRPILFRKGTMPTSIDFPTNIVEKAFLIDTGTPDQATPELVAWVRSREEEVRPALTCIGKCTERLLGGESVMTVFPDHHKAQVALGVVTEKAQEFIAAIEQSGGVAKVLGAGARTGGCGMVLAVHPERKILQKLSTEAQWKVFND
jgi:mevalonate kinase